MEQTRVNLTRCRNLTQVLQHTGRLTEPAIAQILAQLLGYLEENPNSSTTTSGSCSICAKSVWLAVGAATVETVALRSDNLSRNEAETELVELAYAPKLLRGDSVPAVDNAWAIGSLAVECALGSKLDSVPTAISALRDSREFTPAFLDIVSVCLRNTIGVRPTVAALREHQLFVQHASAAVWLRKDGRLQLRLSKEIVEAGTRYLYSELRAGDHAAVSSFLTDESVVLDGSAVTSGLVAAKTAVKNQSLDGCVAKAIAVEPASHETTARMEAGAQASWIATVNGVTLDGSVFSHRLTLGIAGKSIDELVVERWETILSAPSAGKGEATTKTELKNDPAGNDVSVHVAVHTSTSVETLTDARCGSEHQMLSTSFSQPIVVHA